MRTMAFCFVLTQSIAATIGQAYASTAQHSSLFIYVHYQELLASLGAKHNNHEARRILYPCSGARERSTQVSKCGARSRGSEVEGSIPAGLEKLIPSLSNGEFSSTE